MRFGTLAVSLRSTVVLAPLLVVATLAPLAPLAQAGPTCIQLVGDAYLPTDAPGTTYVPLPSGPCWVGTVAHATDRDSYRLQPLSAGARIEFAAVEGCVTVTYSTNAPDSEPFSRVLCDGESRELYASFVLTTLFLRFESAAENGGAPATYSVRVLPYDGRKA